MRGWLGLTRSEPGACWQGSLWGDRSPSPTTVLQPRLPWLEGEVWDCWGTPPPFWCLDPPGLRQPPGPQERPRYLSALSLQDRIAQFKINNPAVSWPHN